MTLRQIQKRTSLIPEAPVKPTKMTTKFKCNKIIALEIYRCGGLGCTLDMRFNDVVTGRQVKEKQRSSPSSGRQGAQGLSFSQATIKIRCCIVISTQLSLTAIYMSKCDASDESGAYTRHVDVLSI